MLSKVAQIKKLILLKQVSFRTNAITTSDRNDSHSGNSNS